jgi:hypothetical protein
MQKVETIMDENSNLGRPGSYHRPSGVTILILGVLSIASINLIGFAQIVIDRALLSSLLPFSPLMLASLKLFWAVVGLVLAWGLYKPKLWALRITFWTCLGYSIVSWLNRLLLYSSSGRGSNMVFSLILNILILVIVFWVLHTRATRRYFGELHD